MQITKSIEGTDMKLVIFSTINDRLLTFNFGGKSIGACKEFKPGTYSTSTPADHRHMHENAHEAALYISNFFNLGNEVTVCAERVIKDTLLY